MTKATLENASQYVIVSRRLLPDTGGSWPRFPALTKQDLHSQLQPHKEERGMRDRLRFYGKPLIPIVAGAKGMFEWGRTSGLASLRLGLEVRKACWKVVCAGDAASPCCPDCACATA